MEKRLKLVINTEIQKILNYCDSLEVQPQDIFKPPSETFLFEWFKKFTMPIVLHQLTLNLYKRPPTDQEIKEMFDMIDKRHDEIISKITFPYFKAGWIDSSYFTIVCRRCNHLNPKKAKYCCNCRDKL